MEYSTYCGLREKVRKKFHAQTGQIEKGKLIASLWRSENVGIIAEELDKKYNINAASSEWRALIEDLIIPDTALHSQPLSATEFFKRMGFILYRSSQDISVYIEKVKRLLTMEPGAAVSLDDEIRYAANDWLNREAWLARITNWLEWEKDLSAARIVIQKIKTKYEPLLTFQLFEQIGGVEKVQFNPRLSGEEIGHFIYIYPLLRAIERRGPLRRIFAADAKPFF